jgi:iron complex transport system substrate-binding protein
LRPFLSLVALLLAVSTATAAPHRIISTIPAVTEILFALDLGDRVVGVTTNCNYPPAAKKKYKIGGFFLNLERVVALKPDLVIMQEDAQQREVERLKNQRLPVLTINPKSVDGVLEAILEVGKATGKEAAAKALTAEMRRRLDRARPKSFGLGLLLSKSPRALVIVGVDPLVVAGEGSFINDILKQSGVENLARVGGEYPQYSLEKMIEENPSYLIVPRGLANFAKFRSDRRWQNVAAVKDGKILFIDQDIISRPGPRVVDAVETIANYVYR